MFYHWQQSRFDLGKDKLVKPVSLQTKSCFFGYWEALHIKVISYFFNLPRDNILVDTNCALFLDLASYLSTADFLTISPCRPLAQSVTLHINNILKFINERCW